MRACVPRYCYRRRSRQGDWSFQRHIPVPSRRRRRRPRRSVLCSSMSTLGFVGSFCAEGLDLLIEAACDSGQSGVALLLVGGGSEDARPARAGVSLTAARRCPCGVVYRARAVHKRVSRRYDLIGRAGLSAPFHAWLTELVTPLRPLRKPWRSKSSFASSGNAKSTWTMKTSVLFEAWQQGCVAGLCWTC